MNAVAVVVPEQEGGEVYWIASLSVAEGQAVETGQFLARLEGRRGKLELHALRAGFITGLYARPGQTTAPGDVLCYLADKSPLAAGKSTGPLSHIIEHTPLNPTALLIYGGGGHGKAVVELVRAISAYRLVGVIDDGLPVGSDVLGAPVLGGLDSLEEWHTRGVRLAANAVGGIGNVAVRLKIFDLLAGAGFSCPALVHPSAVIEPSAVLESGVQILAQAYVGSSARVGFGSVLNAGAIVSHDCILGPTTNLSPGASLAGFVRVEEHAQIGMNATVNLHVSIGAGCIIGNGATVKADVPPGTRVRAGSIWPLRSE
jgi:acetyltransferase EpsM